MKALSVIGISSTKPTKEKLEQLYKGLEETKIAMSTFSTTKSSYFEIQEETPKFYAKFEQIQKKYENEPEGFEITTIFIPLIKIIEARLENEKKKMWLKNYR